MISGTGGRSDCVVCFLRDRCSGALCVLRGSVLGPVKMESNVCDAMFALTGSCGGDGLRTGREKFCAFCPVFGTGELGMSAGLIEP